MSRYYFQVVAIRNLDCGVRQSVQFTATQMSDSPERAKDAMRRQMLEQYFEWDLFLWDLDFLSWAAIKERENKWQLSMIRMRAEGVYA